MNNQGHNNPLNSGEDPVDVIKKIIIATIATVVIVVALYYSGIIAI